MMPSVFKITTVLLVLFQIAESQNISTSSPNQTIPQIPRDYLSYFRIYRNESDSNSLFLSFGGFKKLLKDLQLGRRYNITKIFRNASVKCHTATEMAKWYKNIDKGLTESNFVSLCPSLLLQIASKACRPSRPKVNETISSNLEIWLYSFGAVIVCSLVGLLVVWLIPIMPKSYYNSISQLLIALAVGSLTGDALLHLIPHALLDDGKGGHSHGGSGASTHSKMVWKSLIALIGIHLFFLTERITILCQNLQSKRKLKNKQNSQEHFYSEISVGDKFDDSEKMAAKAAENKTASTGKLTWASKSRKYSGSFKELDQASSHIGVSGEAHNGSHLCNRPKSKPHVNSDCPDSMNFELCNTINPYSMNRESNGFNANNVDVKQQTNGEIKSATHLCEETNNMALIPESNNSLNLSTEYKSNSNWSNKEDHRLLQQPNPTDGNINNVEAKLIGSKHHVHEEDRVEIGAGGATVKSSLAHPYQNKPHGHHHGHSHDLSSVKAIAYTVIAGDGLHNFCDGIAIGAAFANDIRGGLSTSIAVLCHELPHELGDFVVLLHAGMSLRTAIFYNLMSSIFCAIGMIIGVLLGKLPSVSSWIFMLTAGMFLYIALVDMMPELSTRRLKGKKIFHRPSILFLWQNIGFIIGSAIMLVIALYEDNIF